MINFFRRLLYLPSKVTSIAFSEKYLFTTNIIISVSLSSVGDIIEQNLEIYKKELEKWDKRRTINMGVSGFIVGVFCHHWYNFLDTRLPGRQLSTVIKKVMVDQTIASPIVIFLFFITLGIMRKEKLEETVQEIKHKAIRLYTAEWVVWPPAQLINFYILPTKYRVIYDNTISLGYDIYTSSVINEKISTDL